MCVFAPVELTAHNFHNNMIIYVIIGIISVLIIIFLIVPLIYSIVKKKEISEKHNFISRLINRYTLDKLTLPKNKIYGFSLFCGKQGGGKTYSAVQYSYDLCRKYKSLFVSNTPLNVPSDIQYIFLKDIKDIEYLPKTESYVIFLDEIQTLFDTKNFDDVFYSIFCQLRKRNIKLVGTAQVFDRVALKLREQVHNLYYCKTFLGCITRVKEYYPFLNSGGKLSEKNSFGLGTKIYVQSEKIRNMYDTYYKI